MSEFFKVAAKEAEIGKRARNCNEIPINKLASINPKTAPPRRLKNFMPGTMAKRWKILLTKKKTTPTSRVTSKKMRIKATIFAAIWLPAKVGAIIEAKCSYVRPAIISPTNKPITPPIAWIKPVLKPPKTKPNAEIRRRISNQERCIEVVYAS